MLLVSPQQCRPIKDATGIAHLDTALSYVGVTGKQNPATVSRFRKSVGLKGNEAWCAAFVSYCLNAVKAVFPTVRSAMARSFDIKKKSVTAQAVLMHGHKIPAGYIVVWRRGTTGWLGHVGFVRKQTSKNTFETVEGNTTAPTPAINSRGTTNKEATGDGVFEKTRKIDLTNYFRIIAFTPVREK